jgi:hypothetical protein
MSEITYTWNFNPLEVVYAVDELTNVVTVVHWQFTGHSGSFFNTQIGTIGLTPPTGSFVAYEDLTKEIVTGWVEGTLGTDRIAEMSASVSTSIALQIAPVQGTMTPPWV